MNSRLYSLFMFCGVAVTGCRSFQVTVTGSSATEQLLLVQAWDAALQMIDFQPLSGKKVFFDESNLKGNNKGNNAGWQIYRLRETMCRNGLLLQAKPEDADVIIEGGVAVYGSDATTTQYGLSGVTNMTALAGFPKVGNSSAPLAQCIDHYGAARVALFAFDRRSRKLLWESGDLDGGSCTHIMSAPLLPPRRTGTIATPAQLMGPSCRKVSPSWSGLPLRRASGCNNGVESACSRPVTSAAAHP